jgi:D-sedoheptulose 7-phosphate isomerase
MRHVREIIQASIDVKSAMVEDDGLLATIERVGDTLTESLRGGGKALFCGNGGSAADAQHFAAELSGRFLFDRPPLPAEALHTNTSYLTAVANDYSYEEVYARAVRASGRPGDVLIALSTSGNAANVVRAAEVAREIGLVVVGMTGQTGGALKTHCSYLIAVPSTVTAHIQEAHITIAHALSEIVEARLFGTGSAG